MNELIVPLTAAHPAAAGLRSHHLSSDAFHPLTGERLHNLWGYVEAFEGPRHIGSTFVGWKKYRVRVSTVHLVIDHGFGLSDAPVLYETMVFGRTDKLPHPAEDTALWADFQVRYSWEDEAVDGHAAVVQLLTKVLVRFGHTVVTVPDRNMPIIRTQPAELGADGE